MRILISFVALFLSAILLQLSSGGVVPLDALSGIQAGFTTTDVGILGSAHFFGFFIGCWLAPRLMGTVGHSRAFAAFTALGAIGILSHMMLVDPRAWALMRMMTGLCVAGCYTVIEAWMQAKLTNSNRGRVMGAYRVVDLGGSLAAQMMISILTPAAYMSYNLLAILCCASLLPLTLTKATQPEITAAPRLRPMMAVRLSPLAAAGVIVAGLNGASFRMIGPVYATEIGLTVGQIGLFLSVYVLGGAVAQIPIGYFADKVDRRWVLIYLSIGAMLSSFAMTLMGVGMVNAVLVAIFLFGMTGIPIYSVSTAHGNDFAQPEHAVELNASYMFLYAVGATASPFFASWLIQNFGPPALFYFIGLVHVVLIGFSLLRMRSRPTRAHITAYAYMPRTTFVMGKLLRRKTVTKDDQDKGPDTP